MGLPWRQRRSSGLWPWALAALTLLLLAALPPAAHAKWLKAESARFIVYSSGSERALRAYAGKLEAFEEVLRAYHNMDPKAAAPKKFEVYLVASNGQLRRIAPTASANVYGVYIAGDDGIYAVAVRDSLFGDHVLFHEYTHHFMMQYYPYGYPAWVREGYAEYFATTEFGDRLIEVGKPMPQRAATLLGDEPLLSMQRLLSANPWDLKFASERDAFYAQAWHLTHYMLSDPERKKQMTAYLRAVGSGEPSVEGMEKATGQSADALGRKLRSYRQIRYGGMTRTPPADMDIKVTTLSVAADEVLPESVRPLESIPEADRPAFLARLRAVAAKYPGDRLAEIALARAEVAFGDRAAGEAILGRFLAANSQDIEALRLMGTGRLAAGDAEPAKRAEHYRSARPFLVRAGKADPDDWRILFAYARSRSTDAGPPTENTLNALLNARMLAPQVPEIALVLAQALMALDRDADAAAVLAPWANHPHGGAVAQVAKSLQTKALEKAAARK